MLHASCCFLYYAPDMDHLWAVLYSAVYLKVPQKAAGVFIDFMRDTIFSRTDMING